MLKDLLALRALAGTWRDPRGALLAARGNVELWANLIVIAWAVAFMLWQGVGFAVTIGTVFAIWAILSVSLNLVVGFTGLLSVGHVGFFGVEISVGKAQTSRFILVQLFMGYIFIGLLSGPVHLDSILGSRKLTGHGHSF